MNGSDLYAGGKFSEAGGVSAYGVAKWDGLRWSPLGSGLPGHSGVYGHVKALTMFGSELYAGGYISLEDGPDRPTSSIAKWDGRDWSVLKTGLNDQVYSMAVFGKSLYIAGSFTIAGKPGVGLYGALPVRAVLSLRSF